VRKNFFDSEKTSQSQEGVRNMGILRYLGQTLGPLNDPEHGIKICCDFYRINTFITMKNMCCSYRKSSQLSPTGKVLMNNDLPTTTYNVLSLLDLCASKLPPVASFKLGRAAHPSKAKKFSLQ
jgi:hypothetical protein